jgi:hypothetical protein
VDIADPGHATEVQSWYNTAREWWNPFLEYAGVTKRIDSTGAWVIREGALTYPTAAEFNPVTKQITIDPRVYSLATTEHKMSLLGHELGHALGIHQHSPCVGYLMSAEVNSAVAISDAEKCWVYTEYHNFSPVCLHL